MIFRIVDNKLKEIDIQVEDENEFVLFQNNENEGITYIAVAKEDLPENTHPEVEPAYMLDSDGNIILDEEDMISRYKDQLIDSINNIRNFYIAQGFNWDRTITDADGNETTVTYNFGLTQDYINGFLSVSVSVLMGQTDNLFFITTDNITVSNLTPEEAQSICLTASQTGAYIIYKAREYKDRIIAATTFDEIDQILIDMKNDQF